MAGDGLARQLIAAASTYSKSDNKITGWPMSRRPSELCDSST